MNNVTGQWRPTLCPYCTNGRCDLCAGDVICDCECEGRLVKDFGVNPPVNYIDPILKAAEYLKAADLALESAHTRELKYAWALNQYADRANWKHNSEGIPVWLGRGENGLDLARIVMLPSGNNKEYTSPNQPESYRTGTTPKTSSVNDSLQSALTALLDLWWFHVSDGSCGPNCPICKARKALDESEVKA